jgi:hypothetical protein
MRLGEACPTIQQCRQGVAYALASSIILACPPLSRASATSAEHGTSDLTQLEAKNLFCGLARLFSAWRMSYLLPRVQTRQDLEY